MKTVQIAKAVKEHDLPHGKACALRVIAQRLENSIVSLFFGNDFPGQIEIIDIVDAFLKSENFQVCQLVRRDLIENIISRLRIDYEE